MNSARFEKTVLVTGASSGIGAATARRFAEEGARVILLARRRDKIDVLAQELGEGAEAHAVDVRDRDAVAQVMGRLPAPDVVLISAGLARGRDPLDETALEDVEEILDTNVLGVFNTVHPVLGAMRERNSGHIVVVSSSAAFYPYRGANAYAPSKAAVHMLCQCLRNDLGGTRVRVSEIAPAMVENTGFTAVRFRGDQGQIEGTYKGLDVLQAEDVADAVFYCASAPERVNVDLMVLFPVQQHIGGAVMHRDPA